MSGGICRGIYARKFATVASKLFESVANCSERTANQNTNIAAEVGKVTRKRTSGLTVNSTKKSDGRVLCELFSSELTSTYKLGLTC